LENPARTGNPIGTALPGYECWRLALLFTLLTAVFIVIEFEMCIYPQYPRKMPLKENDMGTLC
jgi:hypothetical protein